ncbi:MAG TPA: hypothetical protein VFJ58_10820 [Armatimonadota bacterium]|nr:hypothetical protein [Armatimonadota bacterium]
MFGFGAKLPVSEKVSGWIDASMAGFVERFGLDRLHGAEVALPTDSFFPDPWTGADADVEPLLRRVCSYMRVDPARLTLNVTHKKEDGLREILPYWSESSRGAAGLYQEHSDEEKIRITVFLDRSSQHSSVIATIAHELGHVLLLADGVVPRDAPDMEQLTDLITVFCGLGVLSANSVIRSSQWDSGTGRYGWSVERQGYLSEEMYGYALAVFAMLRGETDPAWSKHLNLNVRTYLKQSLNLLARRQKTAARLALKKS